MIIENIQNIQLDTLFIVLFAIPTGLIVWGIAIYLVGHSLRSIFSKDKAGCDCKVCGCGDIEEDASEI